MTVTLIERYTLINIKNVMVIIKRIMSNIAQEFEQQVKTFQDNLRRRLLREEYVRIRKPL